ncbi:hypothetical protein PanWU01x14_107770 [Parasponia andersonii]|uniref:Uncharacterized protein n=1 Tax=Parasponia andersonii TaxID=3476 RepID=A0A2P5D0A9_PARAD|nr:hypothetical protein PanWU01x14_107770 [Parasponia andersonii]
MEVSNMFVVVSVVLTNTTATKINHLKPENLFDHRLRHGRYAPVPPGVKRELSVPVAASSHRWAPPYLDHI